MLCFFNDTATTEISTLSLHDALPIYQAGQPGQVGRDLGVHLAVGAVQVGTGQDRRAAVPGADDEERLLPAAADQPVEQRVDHGEPGAGAPVTEQPRLRSAERRVGKESRSRWSPYH